MRDSNMTLRALLLIAFITSGNVVAPTLSVAENNSNRKSDDRPNIMWLSTEDIGPQLACYGDTTAKTPNLDQLAKKGMVYDIAWSNYPVCAPARTTIISGMYGASNGAGNMRSLAKLPKGIKMFPQYMRDAGYYCTNATKEDYNLVQPGQVWDQSNRKATFANRAEGQPFFAVFNQTVTHESKIRRRPHKAIVDPASVKLTPYWPDLPEVRQDWAQYYDNLQTMDDWVGKKLKELDQSGEADNTIVIFFGDHGSGMPRHKRYAGDSGMLVPFVVYVPEKLKADFAPTDYVAGGRSDHPVGFVDLAPTMLSIANIAPPEHLQGHAFMGPYHANAPQYLYGLRGRMDERPDLSRSIRDDQYIYVRNFLPHVPSGQFLSYQHETPTTAKWFELYKAGKLNDVQSAFWENHPPEELYDLNADPFETKNLVGLPEHKEVLDRFRKELYDNTLKIRDAGFAHEGLLQEITVAGKQTRREFAQDEKAYPLEEIFEAANMVGTFEKPHHFVKRAQSNNRTVRYWATVGLLNVGQAAVDEQLAVIESLLADPAPEVAMSAAEILIKFNAGDVDAAKKTIVKYCDPTQGNLYHSVAALNIVDRNLEAMKDQMDEILAVPQKDPNVKRGENYVKQMLDTISSRK